MSFLLNYSLRRLPVKARIRALMPFSRMINHDDTTTQRKHLYCFRCVVVSSWLNLSLRRSADELPGAGGGADEAGVAAEFGEANLGLRRRHRERVNRHVLA